MEVLFVIIIIFALVAIGAKTNNNIAKKPKREYVYAKKACAMTQHELIFYKTLLEAIRFTDRTGAGHFQESTANQWIFLFAPII